MIRFLTIAACCAALTACSSSNSKSTSASTSTSDGMPTVTDTSTTTNPTAGGSSIKADLHIVIKDTGGERTLDVKCPSGSETQLQCDALAADTDMFAETKKGMMCTEVYGGPETATVTGTINGKKIDTKLSRTNGCEIHRWERASALVGPRMHPA